MNLGVGSIVSVGGGTGGSGGSSSGITTINPGGNTGPTVTFQGVNGAAVTSPSTNVVLIDVAGASGVVTKFTASFTNITSGIFSHNLNSEDVIVQVHDRETPRRQIIFPDAIIIENSNQVSVLFNRPQSGRIIII